MIQFEYHKITIVRKRRPLKKDLNEELQWFGSSLGLFNLRDKDKSCYRIFIELLKSVKKQQHLSSDEIAHKLNLSRGTVVHHLKNLMATGIVINQNNKYILRVDNLEILVEEVEKDITRTLEDLKRVAIEIDAVLGL